MEQKLTQATPIPVQMMTGHVCGRENGTNVQGLSQRQRMTDKSGRLRATQRPHHAVPAAYLTVLGPHAQVVRGGGETTGSHCEKGDGRGGGRGCLCGRGFTPTTPQETAKNRG